MLAGNIKKIYLGGSPVQKMYLGSTLIYPNKQTIKVISPAYISDNASGAYFDLEPYDDVDAFDIEFELYDISNKNNDRSVDNGCKSALLGSNGYGGIIYNGCYYNSSLGYYYSFGVGGSSYVDEYHGSAVGAHKVSYDKVAKKITMDGKKTNFSSDVSGNYKLFYYNFGTSLAKRLKNRITRFKNMKMYKNGQLYREYIPAIDADNNVALFETVTKQYIQQIGSGCIASEERSTIEFN